MANPTSNSVSSTGINYIDGLLGGSSWQFSGSRTLTYSTWDSYWGHFSSNATSIINQLVSNASNVANINFQFSGHYNEPYYDLIDSRFFNNSSDISIATFPFSQFFPGASAAAFSPNDLPYYIPINSLGTIYYPSAEGDIFFNSEDPMFLAENLYEGSLGYTIGLHELGHALGLKHPFELGDNGQPTFSQLGINDYDSQKYTILSYDSIGNGTTSGHAASFMPFDIAALQHIYGVNNSYNTGNNTYSLGTNRWETIWDAGGNDTITSSGFSVPTTIDLREGLYSSTATNGNGGYLIAYNAIIENATGGSGNDTLTGNSSANTLYGGLGADTLDGRGGNDTLIFSADFTSNSSAINGGSPGVSGTGETISTAGKNMTSDVFKGGTGSNTLNLTGGSDAVFLDSGSQRIFEIGQINAGAGDDIVDLTSPSSLYPMSPSTVGPAMTCCGPVLGVTL